jgi:aminoglycoside phosphotransferase (APT) family kinase protein
MTTAVLPGTAPTRTGEPLLAAVGRRSPGVAAALDEARAREHAARALPDADVAEVGIGSVLYRPDGGCTLRYEVHPGAPARAATLLVEVPPSSADTVVRAFPDDPGLPTLRAAVDPDRMRDVLGRVVPGTGGARAIGRCRVDVVHHPRRDRCVLRYRLSPGAGGSGELRHPALFGKVHADPARAAAGAEALRFLRTRAPVLADGIRLTVPRPLAVVPELRLGLAEAVPGRALVPELLRSVCAGEGGPAAVAELYDAVRTAGRAIAAVHGCATPAGGPPVRDLAGERTAVAGELAAVAEVWPDVASRLRVGLAREAAAEQDGPPLPVVLAHGDWTPGQVLLDGAGGVAVVDVDTLGPGEPALDLGRFLAYLHVAGMRRSQDAWPLLARLSTAFLDAYLEARPAAGAERRLLDRTAAFRGLALAHLGASASWQLKDGRLAAVLDVFDAGNRWTRGGTR